MPIRMLGRMFGTALLVAACAACGSKGEEVPPLDTNSVTPPQATALPERVQGCVRAGEADGTFVLTASSLDTRLAAATYQLEGMPDELRPYVGQRVEVAGTIVSEQTAQSRGLPMTAADAPAGTSGQAPTPTVQSKTTLEIKRLQVASVTPVSGECGGS